MHKDDRNKRSMSNVKLVQEMSKPLIGKTSWHNCRIYYGYVWILGLSSHIFFKYSWSYISKVYITFPILVLAISSIIGLNLFHKNIYANSDHFNCKTFSTEILDINRTRHNYGEMAEITYPHSDQNYGKFTSRNSISRNSQKTKVNESNIEFFWINFVTSLLFLCKQFHNPTLFESSYHHLKCNTTYHS